MKKIIIALFLLFAVNAQAYETTSNYGFQIPAVGDRDWLPLISRDVVSIDSTLYTISQDSARVVYISNDIADIKSTNTTQDLKLTILTNDAVQWISDTTRITIISNDSVLQDLKLAILTNDAVSWTSHDISSGTSHSQVNTNNLKITIISNDAVTQDLKLTILSNDVTPRLLSIDIISNDLAFRRAYEFPTTAATAAGSVISYDGSIYKWGTIGEIPSSPTAKLAKFYSVSFSDTALQWNGAGIVVDASIPENTEGTEILPFQTTFTPLAGATALSHDIIIEADVLYGKEAGAAEQTTLALFIDNEILARATSSNHYPTINEIEHIKLKYKYTLTSDSAVIYKFRIDDETGNVITPGGHGGGAIFGSSCKNIVTVSEYAP